MYSKPKRRTFRSSVSQESENIISTEAMESVVHYRSFVRKYSSTLRGVRCLSLVLQAALNEPTDSAPYTDALQLFGSGEPHLVHAFMSDAPVQIYLTCLNRAEIFPSEGENGKYSARIFYETKSGASSDTDSNQKRMYATCMALNPQGDLLAIGFIDARIRIFVPSNGKVYSSHNIFLDMGIYLN